jgi:hypothetical protein
MIDRRTGLPLRVQDGSVAPYIRLLYAQLDDVRQILDRHGLRYAVRENVISMSGGPFIAVIDFSRETNASAVQAILDAAG